MTESKGNMHIVIKSLLLLGFALAVIFPARAAPIVRPLFELGTPKEPLTLAGDKALYTFKIPVSPRELVQGGTFTLNTVNSTALIRSRSAMTVRLNGAVLQQFALDPLKPRQSNTIDLPAAMLKPGFNDLSVQVIQHYTYECEDASSPELWTEIDPVNSTVELDVQALRPNNNPRLSQLHVAFDSRTWSDTPLTVLTATESFGPAQLGAVSYVTQGVFLRKGKHFPELKVAGAQTAAAYSAQPGLFVGLNPEIQQQSDVVLVGTKSELARLVSAEITAAITGPYLALFPSSNPKHFIFVISGQDEAELFTAARAFASPDFIFTDSSSSLVQGALPKFAPQDTGFGVASSFSKFNFRTRSARGLGASPITLEFRAPGDYVSEKGDFVKLKLHFAYGAGLRKDSAVNIKVNGQFATAIGLSEEGGAEYSNYEVLIPSAAVRPGFNTLSFEPVFIGHVRRCEPLRDENMVLTIFDSSTIEVPRTSKALVVPDLSRFSTSLWPHNEKLQVALLGSDSESVTNAMQVVGSMALKNKGPIDTQFFYEIPRLGHVLVIGSFGRVAGSLQNILPLPARFSWQSGGTASAWMQGQDNQRVLTAFISPSSAHGVEATSQFMRKGFWNAMAGEAVVLDTELGTLDVIPARQAQPFTRAMGLGADLKDWKLVASASAVLAMVFATALIRLLRRRAKSRLS